MVHTWHWCRAWGSGTAHIANTSKTTIPVHLFTTIGQISYALYVACVRVFQTNIGYPNTYTATRSASAAEINHNVIFTPNTFNLLCPVSIILVIAETCAG